MRIIIPTDLYEDWHDLSISKEILEQIVKELKRENKRG